MRLLIKDLLLEYHFSIINLLFLNTHQHEYSAIHKKMTTSVRHIIHFLIYSTIITVFMANPGCTNETPYGEVKGKKSLVFSLNWNENLFPGSLPPDSICFYFYPLNGDKVITCISDCNQLKEKIPFGNYQVLIVNCDVQQLNFRNMDKYETAEVFLSNQTKSESILPEGDILYGASIEHFSINGNIPTQHTIIPQKLVQHLFFTISIDKIHKISECKGSISGMSTALNLSKKTPAPSEPTSVPFRTNFTEKGAEARLFVLGVSPPQEEEPTPTPIQNIVTLDFTFEDGKTASAQINLTDHLKNVNNNDADIKIDSETDYVGNINLRASVKKWENGQDSDVDIH